MKTIAVVCEKGGTGKSVIANELYESYVRQGVPASLYSLDGQYKDASSSKKVEDAEVAIVDTPGVLTDNLSDLVSGADVIVIPVRPTPNDIEPFTWTVSIVAKNTNAPLVIVVNGTNRFRMCASFMAWLEKKPWAKNVVKVPAVRGNRAGAGHAEIRRERGQARCRRRGGPHDVPQGQHSGGPAVREEAVEKDRY